MSDYYSSLKEESGFAQNSQKDNEDSGLDQLLSNLKENSNPKNFGSYITFRQYQHRSAQWKHLARKTNS
jgi:hypothetical protein